MARYIASSVVLCSVLLTGCQSLQQYQRPELYHQRSEEIRRKSVPSDIARLESAKPGQTSSVPSPAGAVALAVATQAESKPSPSTVPGSSPLQMLLPGSTIASGQGSLRVGIYDPCVASDGETQIDVLPSTVLTAKTRNEDWTWLTLDSTKVGTARTVQITALSCRARKFSVSQAKEKGLLISREIPVTPDAYSNISSKLVVWSQADTANEFGQEFANTFYAADVVFVNPNSKPMLAYGSSLTAKVRFLAAKEDVQRVYGTTDPSMLGTDDLQRRLNFKEDWRPLSFSDILAIFTYERESDPRSRLVSLLKSVGEIATGAAVFHTGADYAKGVAFFTGVLVPELEKQLLWDVLLHVKNLEGRSLKEVEEIPPQGQLRKVVFFPRRAIFGVLPEIPVYIAEIRPDPASVSVTVISKEATLTSTPESATP